MNKIELIKFILILACVSISSQNYICFAESQSTCKEWQVSISDYDNKTEAILAGEPEHLIITLQKIIEAKKSGNTETVEMLGDVIKSKAPALSKIYPPEGLEDFHGKLIHYLATLEKAVDAVLKENIDIQSIYMRKCYEALLDYFQELKSVLIEKECSKGDIAALENTIIPGIKRILAAELSEEVIQKKERLEENNRVRSTHMTK